MVILRPVGTKAANGAAADSGADMAATITRKLVSIADAAEALAVSPRTVRRYIADGQLDAVRLGRKTLRIKVDSIERLIDAHPGGALRQRRGIRPPRGNKGLPLRGAAAATLTQARRTGASPFPALARLTHSHRGPAGESASIASRTGTT